MPTRNVRAGWTRPVSRANRAAAAFRPSRTGAAEPWSSVATARSRLLRFNSLRIAVLVAIRSGPPGRCRRLVSPDRRIAQTSVSRSGLRQPLERLPTGRRGQHGGIRRRSKPTADPTSCLFSYSSSLPWPPACRWDSSPGATRGGRPLPGRRPSPPQRRWARRLAATQAFVARSGEGSTRSRRPVWRCRLLSFSSSSRGRFSGCSPSWCEPTLG